MPWRILSVLWNISLVLWKIFSIFEGIFGTIEGNHKPFGDNIPNCFWFPSIVHTEGPPKY